MTLLIGKNRDVVLSSLGQGATLALCNEQHPMAIGYDAARHALGKLFEKKRSQVGRYSNLLFVL
jgi:hypothetical protein